MRSLKDGILKLSVPKKEAKKVEENKYITISSLREDSSKNINR